MRELLSLSLFALPLAAQLSVPITIQEMLYPGDATGKTYSSAGGIARTDEPFCVGIPLADSAGIEDTTSLDLSGTAAGQFRVLAVWPSGNVKWVKVCGLTSLGAGSASSAMLTNSGSGNFGGSNLATDGAAITVDTGAAIFTIKKANHNGIDTATVGATAIVASTSAETRGLVLIGPDPASETVAGRTACSPDSGGSTCATLYSAANDADSTAVIEENGPVTAVVRATGALKSGGGSAYLNFTARYTFFKGQTRVLAKLILRNAAYESSDSGGSTFNTAFKAIRALEFRIDPAISGTLDYTVGADPTACASGVCTGTVNGTSDTLSVYQARPANVGLQMAQQTDCGATCYDSYTTDLGYFAKENSTTLAESTDGAKHIKSMYLDLRDSAGAGALVGIPHGAAMWPSGFYVEGTSMRVGLWAAQNTKTVYIPWPQWDIHDFTLDFHASAPASIPNTFRRGEHPVIARADRAHYNAAGVLPHNLPGWTAEQAFYRATWDSATCAAGTGCANSERPLLNAAHDPADLGTQNAAIWPIQYVRHTYWPDSGTENQYDRRYDKFVRWLRTGQSGRYLDALFFVRQQSMRAWPHSDGFEWRNTNAVKDAFGAPNIACGIYPGDACATIVNAARSYQSWVMYDLNALNHQNWVHSQTLAYFLTGDETWKDAAMPMKNFFLAAGAFQAGTGGGANNLQTVRAFGLHIEHGAEFARFLASVGDAAAEDVLANAVQNFESFVKPDACTCIAFSGDTCTAVAPAGCTLPAIKPTSAPSSDPAGVSRVRGFPTGTAGRGSGEICGNSPSVQVRTNANFYGAHLARGLLALAAVKGPEWPDYEVARALAYGIAQHGVLEHFSDNGEAYFFSNDGTQAGDNLYNGFRYSMPFDIPLACPPGTMSEPGVNTTFDGGTTYYDILLTPRNSHPAGNVFDYFGVLARIDGQLSGDLLRRFRIAMAWPRWIEGQTHADLGGAAIAAVIQAQESTVRRQDIPFSLTDLGDETRVTFTCPAGAADLIVAYSTKTIAPRTGMLEYNGITQTFGLDPANYVPWFAATRHAATCTGTIQSVDIATTADQAPNFSVTALVNPLSSSRGGAGVSSGASKQ